MNKDETEFNKAIVKVSKRYHNMNKSQRVSSLHSFSGLFVHQPRSRIKNQPTAVSKRKSEINTHQKQSMTKTKDLQLRPMKRKMEHNISKVIAGNVLSAKKTGRSM